MTLVPWRLSPLLVLGNMTVILKDIKLDGVGLAVDCVPK